MILKKIFKSLKKWQLPLFNKLMILLQKIFTKLKKLALLLFKKPIIIATDKLKLKKLSRPLFNNRFIKFKKLPVPLLNNRFEKLTSPLLNNRLKNFILIPASIGISLGLFYFMSVLISQNHELKSSKENMGVDFLFDLKMEDLEVRSRRIPKKPDNPEPPPETPKLKVQADEIEKPVMNTDLPKLDLPEDFQSDSQGAGVSGGINQNQEVTPIFRIQPSYPRRAAIEGIEGFVILKFDITETGQTDNISILQASPPQIFNSSAIQALKQWKYKAKQVEGKAIRQNNLKVQLDFTLQKESPK